MKQISVLPSLLLLLLVPLSSSFIITSSNNNNNDLLLLRSTSLSPKKKILVSPLNLADDNNENKPKSTSNTGLDPTVRDKLLAESIAPWRSLRKFIYSAGGAGALIGGLITLTGTLAGLAGRRPDLDMNTEYLNLGIDFGFVAAFAVAWKLDTDGGEELNDAVKQKVERKKEQKALVKGMRERELKLQELSLNVQTTIDGTRTDGKINDLQVGAKQHMVIIVGPKDACRKALIGATIMSSQIGMRNVLVVPYDTGMSVEEQAEQLTTSGFGKQNPVMNPNNQPYVARPTGDGWESYIKAEMDDAVIQSGGEKCRVEGIAIVVEKTGKVIRRGTGEVPWRKIIDELCGEQVEEEDLLTGLPY